MFLYGPKMKLPANLMPLGKPIIKTGDEMVDKPDHLVPLKSALWPDKVKEKITAIFKAIGVPNPMEQKLVEPHARVFGGICDENQSILDDVDWEMLVDYFEWEAAALTDREKSEALQEKCLKKRGGIFSHYQVYENPLEPYY